jgi:hypothetical protein
MTAADAVVFPVEVTVRAWELDRGGLVFPAQHQYVEMLWLPVIGPSSTWLLRRLSGWALACPEGLTVVLPELSESLGLGWSSGPNSSLQRSMRRLMMFGLACWGDSFEVATQVPAVSERQLARMSPGLVRAHDRMIQQAGNQVAA